MKFRRRCVVDEQKEADLELILSPTDSIQQSDIYCLLKGTCKWMSVRDIILCLKGEQYNPTEPTKVRRMLKSLNKHGFVLKQQNDNSVWGHEYQFKIKK